jgi:GTP-binding protein HflX
MAKHRSNLIELERPPITEHAVLVRLVLPSDTDDEVEESLAEMGRLTWTAGADVVCTVLQRRDKPCPGTLVGGGKVEQIRLACEESEVDVAVFDSDLTPTQGANLQDALGVKVLDRTQLILDIFALHARTNEGKHQVELAQLEYTLPRLRGMGSALMRQRGGIGLRGPGEQKLEVDRRVIRMRIARLKAELDEIRKHRRVQRKRRQGGSAGTIALVGYTNAGKSSLLNALTGANALVEDKLFATLDPLSRRCTLPSGRDGVFTDTVGFIRKLPHSLVAAFRATLEEVNEADLILVVADAAHPAVMEHMQAVYEVLDEIQVQDAPLLRVFNKTDLADPGVVAQLTRTVQGSLSVSALTGDGVDALRLRIDEYFASALNRRTLRIPQSEAGVVAQVYESGRVFSQAYEDDEIVLDAELDAELENRLARFVAPS